MSSRTKSRLKPVPTFASLEEEAHFWDTHDTTEYDLIDLDETIEVSGRLKARLEKRRKERLTVLLGLEPKQIRATLRIAQQKGMTSDALIRDWVREGLRRESIRTREPKRSANRRVSEQHEE